MLRCGEGWGHLLARGAEKDVGRVEATYWPGRPYGQFERLQQPILWPFRRLISNSLIADFLFRTVKTYSLIYWWLNLQQAQQRNRCFFRDDDRLDFANVKTRQEKPMVTPFRTFYNRQIRMLLCTGDIVVLENVSRSFTVLNNFVRNINHWERRKAPSLPSGTRDVW